MEKLIEVKDLCKFFPTPRGMLHAVDHVDMFIEKGHTVGVVGESGCGKTTLGRTMIHLLPKTSGTILYRGQDISDPSKKELSSIREKMQIIFQDPYSSLDPRMYVMQLIAEPLRLTKKYSRAEIDRKVTELMDTVGLARRLRYTYPHELDGGRRQRIGIARALALDPEFVVCDEPVSALDVSIQAQVLNLMQDLQKDRGLTYMFITHDLSVVRYISDDICVMYLGQMVEKGPAEEVFQAPVHPYTKALLSALPVADVHIKTKRIVMKGEVTSPIEPDPGCRFAPRCIYASPECSQKQELMEYGPNHFVSCSKAREINT